MLDARGIRAMAVTIDWKSGFESEDAFDRIGEIYSQRNAHL